MYAYSFNSTSGVSCRAVAANYTPVTGEVIFSELATATELEASFSGYAAFSAQQSAVAAAQASASAAIAGGLTISSTGTPAVNGTYSCDAGSVANFNAVETYVLRNGTFPGPSSTQAWVLLNGSIVSIPNTTVFNEIATAIANYVAQVQIYAYSGGQSGSLPSASVTIA